MSCECAVVSSLFLDPLFGVIILDKGEVTNDKRTTQEDEIELGQKDAGVIQVGRTGEIRKGHWPWPAPCRHVR